MDIPDHLKRPEQQKTGRLIRDYSPYHGRVIEYDENLLANSKIHETLPYGDGSYQAHYHPEAMPEPEAEEPKKIPAEYVERYRTALMNFWSSVPSHEGTLRGMIAKMTVWFSNAAASGSGIKQEGAQYVINHIVHVGRAVTNYKDKLAPVEYQALITARTPSKARLLLEMLIPDLDPATDIRTILSRANTHYSMTNNAGRTP